MAGVGALLVLSPAEALAQRDDPRFAYIRSMDRGHLPYPREPFATVFTLASRFADVGLALQRVLPLVVQTPNDLAHIFEVVDDATHAQFAVLIVPVTIAAERPEGWTGTLYERCGGC